MPRKLREEVAGGVHHVWARGNERQLIYRSDVDRETYLALLADDVVRHGWRCLSYCLMPNHVHLLVETPQANLGHGMQRLHGDYAHAFNKRHDRCGHLFQGRFGSVRMGSDRHVWAVVAYIALNPVKAGLCELPEAWRWSSHAAVLDGVPPHWLDVDRLLWFVNANGGEPRRAYADLVGGWMDDS